MRKQAYIHHPYYPSARVRRVILGVSIWMKGVRRDGRMHLDGFGIIKKKSVTKPREASWKQAIISTRNVIQNKGRS